MNVYDQLSNPGLIERITRRFYHLVTADADLAPHYQEVNLEDLVFRRTTFMRAALGGPAHGAAHLSTAERAEQCLDPALGDLRRALILQALHDSGAPEVLREAWLKIEDRQRQRSPRGSGGSAHPS
ncbi:MAG: hypothetical protein AAF726_11500 [Planctomycetota bacterium]